MAATTSTPRRTKIISGVCTACFLGIIALFGFGSIKWWVGSYDLTVRFDGVEPLPKSIECTTVHRMEEAVGFRECLNDTRTRPYFEKDYNNAFIGTFNGEPLTLPIRTSGRENGFGIETAWTQKRFLVVVAHWPDGRETMTVADIPDGRKSREMSVSLP